MLIRLSTGYGTILILGRASIKTITVVPGGQLLMGVLKWVAGILTKTGERWK